MKKIRRGVFETNSSSTHSINIAKGKLTKDLMDSSLIPDEDGNIVLSGGEFGWEIESYQDAKTKANYLAILLREYDSSVAHKTMFVEVIKKQTGCKQVIWGWEKDSYDSYIDHGGEHGIGKEVFADKETLRNFLFNRNSWLFTTNDNCETRWRIAENGEPETYEDEYDC